MQQRALMELPMNMTPSFLFWAVFASYVVHIVDETLIGGGFAAKVREHWWPTYTARMFFFFNAAFLAIGPGSVARAIAGTRDVGPAGQPC